MKKQPKWAAPALEKAIDAVRERELRDRVLPLVTEATIEQPYIDSALGALPSACSSDWCYCRELQQYADLKRLKPLVEAAQEIDAGVFDEDGQCAICHAEGDHKPDYVCWTLHEALAQFSVEGSDATDEAL